VAGRIQALAAWLFRDVPCGVGVGGPYKFDAKDIRRILSDGSAFLERKGLARPDDVEATESGGRLEGADPDAVSDRAVKRGGDQCGTLGAGNHFVEVQYVEKVLDAEAATAFGLAEGMVTVMIHSGSRGLGYQVCDDYLKELRNCPSKYGIELPDRQLVCAPFDSPEARRYMAAMRAAANFAWANRQLLARQVRRSLAKFFGQSQDALGIAQVYDVGHNMAKVEAHIVEGREMTLCVHRKGATRAFPEGHRELPERYRSTGQPVLIPGDMGTASWVLVGTDKAMAESFGSSCHGAGRVMSRGEAIRSAKGRRIDKELASKGIYAKARGRTGLAEEQPDAYKDIDAVVDCVHAAHLARKVARLVPMAVVKG
jgi:tRNA-splicing ligase RtcB